MCSLPNGTCAEDVGGCGYEEGRIPGDPAICEAIAGGCGVVQCLDTDCALTGTVDLEPPACDRIHEPIIDDTQQCEAVTTPVLQPIDVQRQRAARTEASVILVRLGRHIENCNRRRYSLSRMD